MSRTLILSCSQAKKLDEADIPAIQRYDGPAFRLLRRYLTQSNESLEIYVLSAKFGLITHQTLIPFYEQKLQSQQVSHLKQYISNKNFFSKTHEINSFFINLGKIYMQVFEPVFEDLVKSSNTTLAIGSSGRRLAEMYDWLYGEQSSLRNEQPKTELKEEVFIQGVHLKTNEKEIRTIIKNEIAQNGMKNLQSYQSWFVAIDDLRISPKWLISYLTKLPVSRFHSDQARKALQKLGIKVERV